ncbi:MAG: phosphodiester glycosidase family protein [Oscillospiraceae bacterium]|nr:phosphodiester glycosidase family protein [Oscillospiraceae bacterium]
MGTFNGNTRDSRFASRGKGTGKQNAPAWKQVLYSLLLLMDLFLLYTIIMQLTHKQMAFETSKEINLMLLALFALGAAALIWLVIRTCAWKRLACLTLIFAILYLTAVFSNIKLVKKYREMWISTAMSTMRHQGLATFYFPHSMVKEITDREENGREGQVGVNSSDPVPSGEVIDLDSTDWVEPTGSWAQSEEFQQLTRDQKQFYTLFYELNLESAEAYFQDHPDAVANGYMHMLVNESSLDSEGTTIRTKLGEKVLAIDAENQILLLEVDCDGSRGVLAVAKRPDRLHLFPSAKLPNYGETAGAIAKRNDGILAMTGSGFLDEGGVGNGGQIAGWAMCGGKTYGSHFGWGYKRLELHENNWFYIADAYDKVSSDTTDAMEFSPALIVDGKKLDPGIWTSENPRACIGQSERGEILMLCVEGRTLSSPGCSVDVCADVMLQHDGRTALNCDGGTTAIMWYRGEPVIRCSNSAIPQGRYLPNAWVYVGE